jgi:glyoxylase-like metal-dependent hydrolase (beta-lactamase superfamily II)
VKSITRIAPDVGWLPVSFSNVYFIGRPGGKWVLLDTAFLGCEKEILAAADARFGTGSRPESIILTHGHMDHAGSAMVLAEIWDVPIYVHRREIPFLTGKAHYPPADPTVGGALAFLSRFYLTRPHNLSGRIRELEAGEVPGASGWQWLATPGHSPGHIALFRSSDRVLLAGDAFTTVNMDSWTGLVSGRQQLSPPPRPFTIDWEAARSSLKELAHLRPNVAGSGHGIPIADPNLPDRMQAFAQTIRPPRRGRYSRRPARTDENGIVDLPPPPFDPVPLATAVSLLLAGIALGAGYLEEKRQR